VLQELHEGVSSGQIFHLKSQFAKSWMQNIGGQHCTRMFSNIAKLVTIINEQKF
jgi:hypothetical protein